MLQFLRNLFWIFFVPLALVWAVAAKVNRIRRSRRPERFSVPIISVGNIHSGGTGKTPIVAELYSLFQSRSPIILSRGYRARASHKGAMVNLQTPDGVGEYGDEPWLFAQRGLSVAVGRERRKLIRELALDKKHGVILLDDGFQHVPLARQIDLVLLPGWINPEESWCLPLGSLRESLTEVRRASGLLLMNGKYSADWRRLLTQLALSVPLFEIGNPRTVVKNNRGEEVRVTDLRLGGFSGIANAQRFQSGFVLDWITFKAFPDHHRYSSADIQRLCSLGQSQNLSAWVTTEKDIHKVRPLWPHEGPPLFTAEIHYQLPQELSLWLTEQVPA